MLKKYFKIQDKINKAFDKENEKKIERLGKKQDEIVKKMNDDEFDFLMSLRISSAYKIHLCKLRKNG